MPRRSHKAQLQPKLTAKFNVGNRFIPCYTQATPWLAVWLDANLTFKKHYNRCIKKARAVEARLLTFTKTYGEVPESVRAVKVACIQVVALYGSELWWDPEKVARRHDIELRHNQQTRSVEGALPTTQRGDLITQLGLTPVPVILDSRQQQFAVILTNACSSKLKELEKDLLSGTPTCRVVEMEHQHGWTNEGMSWPVPGEDPVVESIILDDTRTAYSDMLCWVREKAVNVGEGVWLRRTNGSPSDDSHVGAAAACKQGNVWRTRCSRLGTGLMKDVHVELREIGLALRETVKI